MFRASASSARCGRTENNERAILKDSSRLDAEFETPKNLRWADPRGAVVPVAPIMQRRMNVPWIDGAPPTPQMPSSIAENASDGLVFQHIQAVRCLASPANALGCALPQENPESEMGDDVRRSLAPRWLARIPRLTVDRKVNCGVLQPHPSVSTLGSCVTRPCAPPYRGRSAHRIIAAKICPRHARL